MSPQAQRIAIAEACGWEKIDPKHPLDSDTWEKKGESWQRATESLPRYPTDLNAMHDAEKCFAEVDAVLDRRSYISSLMKVVGVSPDMAGKWSFVQDFALSHATAAQRAEAFLRTLSLWDDSK